MAPTDTDSTVITTQRASAGTGGTSVAATTVTDSGTPAVTTRRLTGAVTSVSWIPSEAIPGLQAHVFGALGVLHYDPPPPDRLGDLAAWAAADRFRFANALRAWVEVDDGPGGPVVLRAGYDSGSLIGSTTVRLGRREWTFDAVALPELQAPPEVHPDRVRFVQTFGGHTSLPGPRRVAGAPWVQLRAPLVWTTLALTVHLDGRVTHEVLGASRFPRHWVYGHDGRLEEKVGVADFDGWYRRSFGRHTPWGDEDSPALVTAAETALERALARSVMGGAGPARVAEHDAGTVLFAAGEPGDEVLLLLDGVVRVEVDGRVLGDAGPGAVLGERAAIGDGRRTATVRCSTRCRVAAVPAGRLDPDDLTELSRGHRRELGATLR